MKLSPIAGMFALALSGSAFAADLPTHKSAPDLPIAQVTWSWTGFYAGANVEATWGSATAKAYDLATGSFLASSSGNSGSGLAGGGQIGYRYQMPSNLVVGALGWGEFAGDKSKTAGGVTAKTTGRIRGGLAGQLGYAFGDVLPYVLGGVSGASADASLSASGPPAFTDTATASSLGWTLGAGVDYHIWGGWIASLQYRYTSFEAYRLTFPTAGYYQNNTEVVQDLALGLNYKF